MEESTSLSKESAPATQFMNTRFYYMNPEAPKPNLPPTIGCVAIIRNDGRFLLERRADSGLWAFIGGRMEETESAEHALIREVREETNLFVDKYSLLGVLTDPSRIIAFPGGDVRRVISFVFETFILNFSGMSCSSESTSLRFFSVHDMTGLSIAETHEPIVEMARNISL